MRFLLVNHNITLLIHKYINQEKKKAIIKNQIYMTVSYGNTGTNFDMFNIKHKIRIFLCESTQHFPSEWWDNAILLKISMILF